MPLEYVTLGLAITRVSENVMRVVNRSTTTRAELGCAAADGTTEETKEAASCLV